MRIIEASRQTGLSKDMIRHYEKLGLIHPKRLENGYRDYQEADLYLLTVIKLLSNLGIPLRVISAAFASGETRIIFDRLSGGLVELQKLKAQLEARIAATQDSLGLYRLIDSALPFEIYEARPRWLIPASKDAGEGAPMSAWGPEGYFQFYYRQRYRVQDRVRPIGLSDRGYLLYEPHPDAEPVPAQKCIRAVISHTTGRILNEKDLEDLLREARRRVGKAEYTALIYQFFYRKEPRDQAVVCAEILLGEEQASPTDREADKAEVH